jgi:hypothetical protein
LLMIELVGISGITASNRWPASIVIYSIFI